MDTPAKIRMYGAEVKMVRELQDTKLMAEISEFMQATREVDASCTTLCAMYEDGMMEYEVAEMEVDQAMDALDVLLNRAALIIMEFGRRGVRTTVGLPYEYFYSPRAQCVGTRNKLYR